MLDEEWERWQRLQYGDKPWLVEYWCDDPNCCNGSKRFKSEEEAVEWAGTFEPAHKTEVVFDPVVKVAQ